MNKIYEIICVCNGGLVARTANEKERVLIELSKALGYSSKNEFYLFFETNGYHLRNHDFGAARSNIFHFVAPTEAQVFKMLESFLYEEYRCLQEKCSMAASAIDVLVQIMFVVECEDNND